MSRVFFDTNVLVYADVAAAPEKQRKSQELLIAAARAGNGVLSTQVLLEYYNVAVRRLRLSPAVALQRVRDFSAFHVVVTDAALVLAALELSQLGSVSHWDALIVRAAASAGCSVLYSEDLQANRVIDGVRVVNPYA